MEQIVSIREMNQRLSHYLAAVERGEVIVITRRGRPVARLSPLESTRELTEEQRAARRRALARMRAGYSLGGAKVDRDEIHER
ncbi:MAG: type II toxin-antitoxin system prevent-host-death family antitoxin [Polyangia bacterium]